ncbi:Prephenate dehydrogenase [Thermodesulfobium narugense DSM 14796]|uniref:Prephenate dehydrogenase n=1 Tax=Thermodesulfobium narugense DSM 14796 TaxID=747365 RepID=M1E8B5_9BACT|nr:prephenate dehydrogenase [Thermodesulfobium narugense]AEE14379.1 Prephenate dehydrogenase [Thermodesulfobium narugense DSM 14796]
MDFKNICVIGLGLIGGSLAKAFSFNGYSVYGYDSSIDTINLARSDGFFRHLNDKFDSNISFCDLVFVCVNIEKTLEAFKALIPYLKNNCIVSDVASVKSHFFDEVSKIIPKDVNFISTHPMAGTQYSGYENSFKEIFFDRPFLIIENENAKHLVNEFSNFLKINLRVNIQLISINEHDSLVSLVSHLPMFVALSLSNTLRKYDQTFPYLNLVAGPGFKDTSRLALQDPNFTYSIFKFNKKEILKAIDSYIDTLSSLRDSFDKDIERFRSEIVVAKEFRGRF